MKRCRCRNPIRVEHAGGYPLCDRCGERLLSDAERLVLVLHGEIKTLRRRVEQLEAERRPANGGGQLRLEQTPR